MKRRMFAALIGLCLMVLASPIFAQGGTIQIGQNATGTLSTTAATAQYTLTAQGGETAMIQVLALSQGFVPSFSVTNPAGVQILNAANADGKATLSGSVSFSDPGVYTITVGGVNGSTGQFALSVQAGAPLPQPVALTVNQPVTGTVGAQTPALLYRFDTSSLGSVGVVVSSQTAGAGALVTLFDETTGKTVASSDAGVVGAAYQLPADGHVYHVEVSAAGSTDTAFSICMGTCAGGLSAGNSAVNPQPTLIPNIVQPTAIPNVVAPPIATPEVQAAGCSAMSSAGGAVNLRSGPGTQYAVLSQLPLGQTAQVLAEWTGGGWYEVNVNGGVFWVGGSVVNLSGDCNSLPRIAAPTNAPFAPTRVPQPPASTPEVGDNNGGNNGGNNNGGSNGGNNNSGSNGGATQNLPNLTTTNLQITVDPSGNYSATVTILNLGKAPITPDMTFAVLVCVDNSGNCKEVANQSITLQPGDTITLSYLLPSFTSGSHIVTLTLDSNNDIKESDESDNSASAQFNN